MAKNDWAQVVLSATLFFLTVFCVLSSCGKAADLHWVGGDGNWSERENWDPKQVPSGSDNARVYGGIPTVKDMSGAFQIYIGGRQGESGEVKVIGPGKLGVQNNIYTGGSGGIGRLIVEGGGNVSTGGISIGEFLNGSGGVEIRHPDSMVNSDGLIIGKLAEGYMTVEDGGKVNSGEITWLGYNVGANGSATVKGAGSRWQQNDRLLVGYEGQGSVAVEDGGTVVSEFVGIGGADAGDGTRFGVGSVTVTGANSSWISNSTVRVAGGDASSIMGNGIGELRIREGGAFSSVGEAIIAVQDGSRGSVLVEGADSKWSVGGAQTVIANRGEGSLTVRNGAKVDFTGVETVIGRDPNSVGKVLVSDPGSIWSNVGPVIIGIFGRADVTMDGGGVITVPNVIVVGQNLVTNSLNINGGTSPQSRGVLQTGFVESTDKNGRIKFNGGVLRAAADEPKFVRPDNNSSFIIDVLTRGAFIDTNGFTVGINRPFSGAGGLTKLGQGTLTLIAENAYLGPTAVEQGTLQLGAPPFGIGDNRLLKTTVLTVGNDDDVGSAMFNLNSFNQEVGALSSRGSTMSRRIINSGADLKALTVAQSNDTVYRGQLTGNLSLVKKGGGSLTITGDNTHAGPTIIEDGALVLNGVIAGSIIVKIGGVLRGTGHAGLISVQNGGTVSPGHDLGTLHVDGTYTQFAGGKLFVELGSINSFDKLQVMGDIMLDGILELSLQDGFVPSSGMSFDVLDWSGIRSGTFSTVMLPPLPNGLFWNTSKLYVSGHISVD